MNETERRHAAVVAFTRKNPHLSSAEIAEEFGYAPNTVRKILSRYGVDKGYPFSPLQRELAAVEVGGTIHFPHYCQGPRCRVGQSIRRSAERVGTFRVFHDNGQLWLIRTS